MLIDAVESKEYLEACSIAKVLRSSAFTVYFAGGFVRDCLLGLPVKDIDIVTSATPSEIKELFPKIIPVGEHFGVLLVWGQSHYFEVATFRKDSEYKDGRHPEKVYFVGDREDAQRRDFTINGLFYDPFEKKVVDYVSGQEDLQKKIIRAIGNPLCRFEEDKLRMLRAIRFSARLCFDIEKNTWRALRQKSSLICQVSFERIRDEISKILPVSRVDLALDLLKDSGLFIQIFPEIAQHNSVSVVLEKGAEMLMALRVKESFPLLFATLFFEFVRDGDSLERRMILQKICRKLHFSKRDMREVLDLTTDIFALVDAKLLTKSALKKILRKKHVLHQLEFLRVHELVYKQEGRYKFYTNILKRYSRDDLFPTPFVTGKTLLAWGYKASPEFSTILHTLEELQLEDKITNADQAKSYVLENFTKI